MWRGCEYFALKQWPVGSSATRSELSAQVYDNHYSHTHSLLCRNSDVLLWYNAHSLQFHKFHSHLFIDCRHHIPVDWCLRLDWQSTCKYGVPDCSVWTVSFCSIKQHYSREISPVNGAEVKSFRDLLCVLHLGMILDFARSSRGWSLKRILSLLVSVKVSNFISLCFYMSRFFKLPTDFVGVEWIWLHSKTNFDIFFDNMYTMAFNFCWL